MLSASPVNDGVRKIVAKFEAIERHKRYRKWLRSTTGVAGIYRLNAEIAIRNTVGLRKFLKVMTQVDPSRYFRG